MFWLLQIASRLSWSQSFWRFIKVLGKIGFECTKQDKIWSIGSNWMSAYTRQTLYPTFFIIYYAHISIDFLQGVLIYCNTACYLTFWLFGNFCLPKINPPSTKRSCGHKKLVSIVFQMFPNAIQKPKTIWRYKKIYFPRIISWCQLCIFYFFYILILFIYLINYWFCFC